MGLNTRSRAQKPAAQAVQQLVDDGKIDINPFRAVKPPKVPKAKIYVPTEAELRRLIRAAKEPQTKAIVMLALTAELRINELCALRYPHDVDLERGRISVTASLKREEGEAFRDTPKTKTSNRVVYLPPRTISAIKDHLAAP